MRRAILGQGLSFAAMLLPPLMGRVDAMPELVFASSAAAVIYQAMGFAFQELFPVSRNAREASICIIASYWVPALMMGVMAAVSLAFPAVYPRFSRNAGYVALMLLSTAIYNLALAHAVRSANLRALNGMRLLYGTLTFALTGAFCYFRKSDDAAVLATASALLLASAAGWAYWRDLFPMLRAAWSGITVSDVLSYNRLNLTAALGNLVASLAFQAGGLALPRLGRVAGDWAVIARVSAGFGTVGQQIIAPPLEMRFAQAMRENDVRAAIQVQARAALLGVLVGLGAAIACSLLLMLNVRHSEMGMPGAGLLMLASAYSLALGLTSVMIRYLVMLGGQRYFLMMSCAKVTVIALGFALAGRGIALLAVIVGCEVVFQPLYAGVIRLSLRRMQWPEAKPL
jgi:hypothetical protein